MDHRQIETPTEQLIEEAIDRGDAAEAKRLVGELRAAWLRRADDIGAPGSGAGTATSSGSLCQPSSRTAGIVS